MPTPVRRTPAAARRRRRRRGRPAAPRCRGGPWPRPGSGRSPGRSARRACALVVEVADDRGPAVGLDRRARSARRSRPRCGRWSSPAGGRARGRRSPSRSMSWIWMWFQAMAIGPVAAGAAIGMTCATPSGRARATSSATMPPSDPPRTRSSRSMPSASSRRHCARAWSRGRDGREARRRTAAPVAGRRTSGRSCRSGRRAGWRTGRRYAVRVERAARADERLPPVAGRVGRAGQRVDDQDLRRRPGRRAVVAIRDDQLRQHVAGVGSNGPSSTRLEPAGPRRGDRPADVGSSAFDRHPAAPTRPRRRRRTRRSPPSSACSRSAMRSSTCSRPTDSRTRSGRHARRGLLLGLQLRVGRGRRDG